MYADVYTLGQVLTEMGVLSKGYGIVLFRTGVLSTVSLLFWSSAGATHIGISDCCAWCVIRLRPLFFTILWCPASRNKVDAGVDFRTVIL